MAAATVATASPASAGSKPWYKILYVQVLIAIVLGALVGWLWPGIATNEWIIRDVRVQKLQRDRAPFSVTVTGYGEGFTLAKHTRCERDRRHTHRQPAASGGRHRPPHRNVGQSEL